MVEVLEHLARQVEHRLVELGLRGKTLTLKVRWSDFQLITRSVSRSQGFQERTGDDACSAHAANSPGKRVPTCAPAGGLSVQPVVQG